MAKIGVNLKIDVTKINKEKMYKGEKGTYLDATIFIDLDNADQFGNHGMIAQSWKDSQKGETPILGNGKIFWRDGAQSSSDSRPQNRMPDFDDDIPF